MANTLNNLGVLYRGKNDYRAAQLAHERALAIYERFAKTAPDVYELEVCRSVILLGLLLKQQYKNETATKVKLHLQQVEQILAHYPGHPLATSLKKEADGIAVYIKAIDAYISIQMLKQEIESLASNQEKIQKQQVVIERCRQFITEGYSPFINELGGAYGSLAWYLLFNKQFAEAEQAARQALDPTGVAKPDDYAEKVKWVHTNLALALLFQGKYAEAEKVYREMKDKPYNKVTYKETFLADLDELEKAGITHPDVAKIRQLLQP